MSCAAGMVAASANKNASELARRVADEVEMIFECVGAPVYHGRRSQGLWNFAMPR